MNVAVALALAVNVAATATATATATETTQQDNYRRPDRLISHLALHPGQRIADVGAGGGYLTLRLARAVGPTGQVLATDIDSEALAALATRAKAANLPQIATRKVPVDDPSLEKATYDRILLAQVDHLLPNRKAYFAALGQALAPKGFIAVSNTERHLPAVQAAARAAGFVLRDTHCDLPGQFLLLLFPP
jgi:2-polyprenyl-3-methyl-5-hydroxy-6-metoxy-1,4-benzoquinol methylase